MYKDTISVSNKIISDDDLEDIMQKMFDDIQENTKICRQEELANQKYAFEYQHWTLCKFNGSLKFDVYFYDDTHVTFDKYVNFISIFKSRLPEIKSFTVWLYYGYRIINGKENNYVSKSINMRVYEDEINFTFDISSEDNKLVNIYEYIKDKIYKAPVKYDRIIKNRKSIISKINFASGLIPSLIICTLLLLIPSVRQIFFSFYVLYPITVLFLGFLVGGTVFGNKLDSLYSSIVPSKKYINYNTGYKDDIDKYINKAEVIIGKNVDNLKNRKEISDLESKYSKYIPIELGITLVISLLIILFRNLFI